MTPQEKSIIDFGKKNGKSRQEVEQALIRLKSGTPTRTPEREAKITQLREEQAVAEAHAAKVNSPLGMFKEFATDAGKRLGELSGITPTGKRIAAGISPYVVPEAELPGVLEELDPGGMAKPGGFVSQAKELGSIALDLPVISLGMGKTIAKTIEEQAIKNGPDFAKFLARPLSEFLPDALKKVAQTEIKMPEFKSPARPSELVKKTQNYLSRKNVGENFDSSIDRLGTSGDPLKQYDEFYDQELKFKNDIKEDTAIGKVGERIGTAYEQVAKQRRDVGQTMGDEIKKVGSIKTDITDSFIKFETELKDNGVTFDLKKGLVRTSPTSKVTNEDAKQLQDYIRALNKMGANPTAAEVDAFLSRIPNELDVYRSKNNITKTTNAERIIKNHLRDLKETLSPKKNEVFGPYYQARSDYAELSDFLDEGSSFLGGKSQTGDYVKDASLAKSSVQSVLNSGKKDWLLTLEDLTGYKALDESVLALQAMSDAGNFRGKSLLDLLSDKPPTSTKGIKERVIDFALDKGADTFVGTPTDQTRRVIQDRLMQGKTTVPTQFKPEPEPKKPEAKAKIAPKRKAPADTQGGFAKNPFYSKPKDIAAAVLKKEPPFAALKDMERFINYVRAKVDPDYDKFKFEADIRDMATKFGINANITNTKLADIFEEVLKKAQYHK